MITRHSDHALQREKQSPVIKRQSLGLLRSKHGLKAIRSLVMTFTLMIFFLSAFSQSPITVIRDSRVDALISRYTEVHSKKASIDGFRIQIAAGTNRNKVYDMKSQFYTYFPTIKQYVVYQTPNFKLRVGNYRERLDAYKDLQKILQKFNGAFIVRDELKLSEL